MNIKRFCLVHILVYVLNVSGLSAQNVINPAEGTWSNKQILVLDVPADGNAYYSLNGADPETSGFAYDGSVLLDVDGSVHLKIVIVKSDGSKVEQTVNYNVVNTPVPQDQDAQIFIKDIASAGIIDYTVGTDFSIPQSLEYSMGQLPEIFTDGAVISIPDDCVISRYVPCTVTDGTGKWRFVIKIVPVVSGIYSRRDVPFEITDWDTFTFTDNKLLYKIDGSWWHLPKLPVKLDRSISHMISWQRIDYSPENPVKFYVVPPKPELISSTDKSGAVFITHSGEYDYKFGMIDEAGKVSELYDSVKIDTFPGDSYKGAVKIGLFFDSVYQGHISVDYDVHKRMPLQPVIVSSAESGFSRKTVTLDISCSKEDDLYVSESGPIILTEDDYSDASGILLNLQPENYRKIKNKKITVPPAAAGAAAYKISAYAVNKTGNKSRLAEYTVIIDQCNYYVDGSSSYPDADGTKLRPYSSFTECLDSIENSRFTYVRVSGSVKMPAGKTIISSNCQIEGLKDARLIFPPDSSIILRNASLAAENCIIELPQSSAEKSVSAKLFQLEHGVLDLNNCELLASFGTNGTAIDSDNSVVNISNSGITSIADVYSSAVSSVNSKLNIRSSRISTVAETSVNFSAQGGLFELRSSSCKVTGNIGRIAELFDTHSSVTGNTFTADLKKIQGSAEPVYMDSKNMSIENSGNTSEGF